MHTPPPCTSPQALPGGESALPAADQEQGDPDIEILKMSKEAERFRKFKLKQMDCKRQELLINEQKLALLEIELALMGPPPALKRIKAEVKAQSNLSTIWYKLFTQMAQENKPFLSWWTKVQQQADKFDCQIAHQPYLFK